MLLDWILLYCQMYPIVCLLFFESLQVCCCVTILLLLFSLYAMLSFCPCMYCICILLVLLLICLSVCVLLVNPCASPIETCTCADEKSDGEDVQAHCAETSFILLTQHNITTSLPLHCAWKLSTEGIQVNSQSCWSQKPQQQNPKSKL